MSESGEEMGVGEVHLLTLGSRDLVLGDMLEESEEDIGPGSFLLPYTLHRILRSLRQAGMNAKLRLYLDGFRTVLKRNLAPGDLVRGPEGMYEREHRSAYVGTLEVRGSGVFLGGVELGEEALRRWIEACEMEFWRGPGLTPERAEELAGVIGTYMREAERRSLETLRRTLGEEVADRLLREKQITVRSANGMEYVITDSGEVFRSQTGRLRHVCVEVRDEERLPRYDRVLAKYLVIRDHPEQIETAHGRYWREHERVLQNRIAELHGELAGLERLRRRRGRREGDDPDF